MSGGYRGRRTRSISDRNLRCQFDEALKILPKAARENSLAMVGKRYCDRLFEHEREFADLPPEKRREEWTRTSKPEMEAFFAWEEDI